MGDSTYSKILSIISFIVYTASIIVLVLLILKDTDQERLSAKYMGLGAGFFLAGVFFLFIRKYIKKTHINL